MSDICTRLTEAVIGTLTVPAYPAVSSDTHPLPRVSVSATISEEAVPGGRIYEMEVALTASALAAEPEAEDQVEAFAGVCEAWANDPATPERLCGTRLKVWGVQPLSSELSVEGDTLSRAFVARVWAALI